MKKMKLLSDDENFGDLYSRFKIESMEIESQSTIFELFRNHKFNMDDIINSIRFDITLARFQLKPPKIKTTEDFIYPTNVKSSSSFKETFRPSFFKKEFATTHCKLYDGKQFR